ncbi:hypothetical protein NEF87_002836 [Candidatus Lokiarchaeum ossiferum]|uniref:Ribbon-helix-helix protein CopG domain-containing protein n=2 Tax=Candidatus Lokiarchaeum ossiferum TaxID=2951803 RepID=A0ABY6HT15_9ARCH|nr:hypothetical protein NEF87_002836 [Candidatus Lokiarchaeum sp. B-35]
MVYKMGSPSKSSHTDSSNEEKESKKIWITLPTKYADILDILADDTPGKTRSNRKSVTVEKMVDEYLEKHEKELTDDGKWEKIISVRKRAAKKLERSIEEKVQFIEVYIDNYPEFSKLQSIWKRMKLVQDPDGIDKIYNKVLEKKEQETSELDSLLETI